MIKYCFFAIQLYCFSDFWYCACGALNLQDNGKCVACGVKKEVSLQNVNKQKLTEIIAKEQEEKAKTTEKAYLSAIKLFDNSKTLEDYKAVEEHINRMAENNSNELNVNS